MYLNVDPNYFDHPKTTRLVARLGRGADVLTLRLWAYCGKFHGEDGRLTGYHDPEIEAIARWWGEPGKMLAAMRELGWMSKEEDGTWRMANWQEHQGHIAALKERGRKMADARWNRIRGAPKEADADSIADSIAEPMPVQCSNQPANQHTLEVGGRVRGEGVEGGARAGSGRFAWPTFGKLPVPLYPKTAREMVEQCEKEIEAIKASAKQEPKIDVVGGMRVRAGSVYEPEAQEAMKAWRQRIREIERAMA